MYSLYLHCGPLVNCIQHSLECSSSPPSSLIFMILTLFFLEYCSFWFAFWRAILATVSAFSSLSFSVLFSAQYSLSSLSVSSISCLFLSVSSFVISFTFISVVISILYLSLSSLKGLIFLENKHFIIQERFNNDSL